MISFFLMKISRLSETEWKGSRYKKIWIPKCSKSGQSSGKLSWILWFYLIISILFLLMYTFQRILNSEETCHHSVKISYVLISYPKTQKSRYPKQKKKLYRFHRIVKRNLSSLGYRMFSIRSALWKTARQNNKRMLLGKFYFLTKIWRL
jgi:hypothetical protein